MGLGKSVITPLPLSSISAWTAFWFVRCWSLLHCVSPEILCGLPFGLHRMCLWLIPGGGSFGDGIALFALNFIIGGVIGDFVLAWRLLVAVCYVPLTAYHLIVG